MGAILGFLAGVFIVISAWDGDLSFWGLPVFLIATLVGVFLFSTTVGVFMTSVMIFSPVAIIAGLINGETQSALAALSIGVAAFVSQFIIGSFRA